MIQLVVKLQSRLEYYVSTIQLVHPRYVPWGYCGELMCRCRCRKIAKSIRILYRARHYLNLDTLKNLYCSFIYSHIAFGTLIWGSNYKSKLLPIHFLQKRALRAITFSDRGIPSRPLFQKLDVLYIFEILKLQLSECVAPENNHGKFFYDFPPPQNSLEFPFQEVFWCPPPPWNFQIFKRFLFPKKHVLSERVSL